MVGTRLSKELVHDIEQIERIEHSDRSTTVRKLLGKAIAGWKLEHSARLYGQSKLTLARAAKEAGTSIWEMMDFVRRHKIPAQYDLEDFNQDMKMLNRRLRP